jgi:hypothetical protein
MQLKAPPGNSIIPALSTCSRCALRLSTVMLIEPNSKKSMNRVAETRGRFWDQGKASVCQNVSNTALKSPKQAHSGRASSSFVPCRLQVQDVSSSVRDLVFAIPVDQPPSSDHFVRSLNAANRTTAAGVVDPASSGNEISVELSLTQRSDPRLFHLPSTASEMKVPKARNMRSLTDPGSTLHIAANVLAAHVVIATFASKRHRPAAPLGWGGIEELVMFSVERALWGCREWHDIGYWRLGLAAGLAPTPEPIPFTAFRALPDFVAML